MTDISGDIYDDRFKVAHVLHYSTKEESGKNYWLAPNNKEGKFILSMGCQASFSKIELVNTHNDDAKDRSTKRFTVRLRQVLILQK